MYKRQGVDVLVARFGGDEVVLLLQLAEGVRDGSVREKSIQLAEALVSILSEPMPVSYTHLDVYKRQSYCFRRWTSRHRIGWGMCSRGPS